MHDKNCNDLIRNIYRIGIFQILKKGNHLLKESEYFCSFLDFILEYFCAIPTLVMTKTAFIHHLYIKKLRAANKGMRQWFSGKIHRCHRWAPGSIPGWRSLI